MEIKKAKAVADFVLVIIHGGNEYYNLPSPRMVKLYRFFADCDGDAPTAWLAEIRLHHRSVDGRFTCHLRIVRALYADWSYSERAKIPRAEVQLVPRPC